MERLLLKPEEAGALLGVGRSKIYSLISSGELPCVRIGGSVRVPGDALRRWVEQHSEPTGEAKHKECGSGCVPGSPDRDTRG